MGEFSIAPSNSWPQKILGKAFCGLRDAMDGKGFSKLCKAGSFFLFFFGEVVKKHVKLGKGLKFFYR